MKTRPSIFAIMFPGFGTFAHAQFSSSYQDFTGSTFASDNRTAVHAENPAPGTNILHVSGLEKPVIAKIPRK